MRHPNFAAPGCHTGLTFSVACCASSCLGGIPEGLLLDIPPEGRTHELFGGFPLSQDCCPGSPLAGAAKLACRLGSRLKVAKAGAIYPEHLAKEAVAPTLFEFVVERIEPAPNCLCDRGIRRWVQATTTSIRIMRDNPRVKQSSNAVQESNLAWSRKDHPGPIMDSRQPGYRIRHPTPPPRGATPSRKTAISKEKVGRRRWSPRRTPEFNPLRHQPYRW
jgi:hypothetical protein